MKLVKWFDPHIGVNVLRYEDRNDHRVVYHEPHMVISEPDAETVRVKIALSKVSRELAAKIKS